MTTQAPLTVFSFGISSWIRHHYIFEFSVHCSHSAVWHTVTSLASGSPFILVAVFFDILTVTFGSFLAFRPDKMSLAHLARVPPLTRNQVFLRAALMETVVWYWRCSLVLLVPAFSLGRAGKYFVFWEKNKSWVHIDTSKSMKDYRVFNICVFHFTLEIIVPNKWLTASYLLYMYIHTHR